MATATSPSTRKDYEQTKEQLKDNAEDASRSLRDMAQNTGQSVREFIHDKSGQASQLKENAEVKIMEHPMRSVALAALGGMVIGALMRR